jgi:DNA-binding NtrC family response regulator
MARLLLIEDEPHLCRILTAVLADHGHEVEVAESGRQALDAAKRATPDVAIVDVNLPDMSGLDVFVELRCGHPDLPGVFITASDGVRPAIAAMKAGAFDYLVKPFDNDEFLLTIDRALELRGLKRELLRLRDEIDGRQEFPGIVGRSPSIQAILRMMPRIAKSDATVLIFGESGTGKELIARSLHQHSRRARGPFVAVNCSAIPATLVESEFFGHERGAFTDAKEQRSGKFEQAHKGTLFLDEVGELSLEAQAKVLRALEEAAVTRVGGSRPTPVDVRVVAATNRNLAQATADGAFREDLYWRLHVVPLSLPSLRERIDDIPQFVDYFLDRFNVELGTQIEGLLPEAREYLAAQPWPGNVRELKNTLKRAMILADGAWLQLSDFHRFSPVGGPAATNDALSAEGLTLAETVARTVSRVERAQIETALAQYRGNRTATAEALGINRKTLFYKMRTFGLVEPSQEDED